MIPNDSLKPPWIDLVLGLMERLANVMENEGQGEVVKNPWVLGVP